MTSAEDRPGGGLTEAGLRATLPGRPVRCYPAVLSTEADAVAWARAGAPGGALVVAEYQVSPRGRSGRPWRLRPGQDLGCSLVLRPRLPPEREGWLYTVAASGLADALGARTVIDWPDEVWTDDRADPSAVGVHVDMASHTTQWAVITLLVSGAGSRPLPLLAGIVAAIERRHHGDTETVLADYRRRCRTLGRQVRIQVMPVQPGGPAIVGRAVDVLSDGALVVETGEGRRVAVRPQRLGTIEQPG